MPPKINRHNVSVQDIEEELRNVKEIHESLLERLTSKPLLLRSLYSNSIEGFGFSMLQNNMSLAKYYFSLGQQAIVSHFMLASFPLETHQLRIGGMQFDSPGYETKDRVSAVDWRVALAMSTILRDYDAIGTLLDVPESVMRKASLPGDEYNFIYVDYLKSMWDKDRTDAGQLLLKAYDAIEEKNLEREDPSVVLRLIHPQLALYGEYMRGDAVEFNKMLEQALNLWKEFYVTEEFRPTDPWGFVYLIVTGIAALAHDKGMKIEVESDYMPKEMYEGKWGI